MQKALVLWSGGKDSALALWETRARFDVAALLTTVTADYDRISMHGVRTSLLRRQARALGYPLDTVLVGKSCTNAEYETRMGAALAQRRAGGVSAVICGDLFLEDIRKYREERLFAQGLTGVFPLWKKDTGWLAGEFLRLGFRAVVCCVDTQALAADFAGRAYDEAFLADLPAGVDPCGENGEFHTFVFAGPLFARAVPWRPGERVLRDGRFCFCDLLLADDPTV